MGTDIDNKPRAGRGHNAMDTAALARSIRQWTLRMTSAAGSSHVGSMFSIADVVAVLYGSVLRYDAANPADPGRDRFILSKGHAGAAVYVALAECGFFSTEQLKTYCSDGSAFSGHISHYDVPGIELSTGSLGHGLSVACGIAYSGRLAGRSSPSSRGASPALIIGPGRCRVSATPRRGY
jgi:transketolase